MGRASTRKSARRAAVVAVPAPVPVRAISPRTVWAATAALAVLIGIVAGILVATSSTSSPPPRAAASGADRAAPAALVREADAVGFYPTTEPGTGRIESAPASSAPPANPFLLPLGAKAPDFTLQTPTGETVSLSQLRGKAVLLEFFATWCPHCNAETPHVRDLFASLPKTRYAWISINADGENAASVFAYHRYYGLSSPALLDPSAQPGDFRHPGAAGPVSTAYRIDSFPTFYVLDPQGRIAWRASGEQPDALLRQELAKVARRG